MMMLRKAWGEVAEQTIRNCFRRSVRSFTGSSGRCYNDHDDPFKKMVDNGEGDSAVGELGFDLNQLREASY